MIPRVYCSPALCTLAPGAQVDLPEQAAHHALKVLRMKAGDSVILFDGQGGEWRAEIIGAGRAVRVALRDFSGRDSESPLHVTLVQALPAGDKMDWVVEKCVELGISAIQPVAAKRSVIRLSAERMARRVAHWNAIASAACEQCGRNRVPEVAPVIDLPQYLGGAKAQNARRLLLAPEGGTALNALEKPGEPVVIMIGPEGGWEEGELLAAQAAGCVAVRLGPRVLRTETAGAAVLAALQARWGDF